MKKKIFAVLLAATALTTLASCGSKGSSEKVTDGGKVFNIRCWNNEFQGIFRKIYPNFDHTDNDGNDILKDGTVVKWNIVANQGMAYQNALDSALMNQNSMAADDKVDMFLVEADYSLKYANSDYSLDVMKDIGLTKSDLSQQYDYTKKVVTDGTGAQKGSSWQAAPGLFAYRRDIAQDVLGTDDPAQVQEQLSSWDKFDAVAKKAKDKNYFMLSGYDDAYRVYSNNITKKMVENGKVTIDQKLKDWVKQTKEYTDKGYNHGTSLWNDQWKADQGPSGKVFGFFYSTWGINFTLKEQALEDSTKPAEVGNGLFGKYACCEGPASYYWGGTWLMGAKGSDNKSLIKDIMEKVTCDQKIMHDYTLESLDYTNNKAAMNEIANDSSYGAAFLGGQNHIALFAKSAEKIDLSNITPYDQGITENYQNSMKDYFTGEVTEAKAEENFWAKLKEVYPGLTH